MRLPWNIQATPLSGCIGRFILEANVGADFFGKSLNFWKFVVDELLDSHCILLTGNIAWLFDSLIPAYASDD